MRVAQTPDLTVARERIRRRTYKTREDARSDVCDYIEMFYNPKRKHARKERCHQRTLKDSNNASWKVSKKLGAIQIAAEGLRRIAEIYAVGADIRGISPGQRLSARQTRSAPLVAAFGDWVQTFLTDGRVEIDNNRVENLIRPITLTRKNALFAGHDEGGIAWGRIASLIETCKINGVEPFAYLKATLTAIAQGHPQSGIDNLLPWNFKPST